MSGGDRANFLARGWRNVREAGTRRLVLTALLLLAAVGLARFSWTYPWFDGEDYSTPVTSEAEQALYDWRNYAFAPQVGPDDRLLLIVYNDQTLINARKRSPLDRGLLAQTLRNLDGLVAKAIGIDILFDQP